MTGRRFICLMAALLAALNMNTAVFAEDTSECEHVWGEWQTEKEATCTEGGTEIRVCSIDSTHTETRQTEPAGHSLKAVAAVEAGCETPGNTAYWTCEKCGRYFSDSEGLKEIAENAWVIEPAGHEWDTGTVTKRPTPFSEGTVVYTCLKDSSHERTETLEKITVVEPEEIRLNQKTLVLNKGKTYTLKPSFLPENTTEKFVVWQSDAADIVMTDCDGNLTAKNIGSAKITAKTANGKTAVCTVIVPGWVKIGTKWKYFNSAGTWSAGKWEKVNGRHYYFGKDGIMCTGWVYVSGKWYYMNASGAMLTGWQKINGKKFYLLSSGAMAVGWTKINNQWYYLNPYGVMMTGWLKISGKRYYLNSNGVMLTGPQKIDNNWYRFNEKGEMLTGWQKSSGLWLYYSSAGIRQSGWQKVSGKWYYLNPYGVMQKGWQKISGSWYYLNSSGVMQTGWLTLNSKKYYLNASGKMLTGKVTIEGKKYEFAADGHMISG